MKRRRLRILYVDETLGFGGSMVALRNLVAALDPARYTGGVAVRADNDTVLHYLQRNLPEHVRIFPIRRRTFAWLPPFQRFAERILSRLMGARALSLTGRAKGFFTLLADSLPAALQMASIAKRIKADGIHTNEQLTTNIAGILAARIAGVPCFSHNRMHGFSRRLSKHLIPLVAYCFAVSEFIKNNMVEAGVPSSKVSVVYDGVDLQRFTGNCAPDEARKEFGIRPDRCLVGIFGRVVEWKGHEIFLRALALASRQDDSLMGFVVGDSSPPGDSFMQRMKAMAKELGIGDRVVFTGYRTDVVRLIAATQIVVVPSVGPEPASLVLFEGMAMSRPLIATRIGGTPELVTDGENGLLIPVGDVEAFAVAMLRLSRDREFAQRLGKNGRHIVEQQFTIQKYAEGISKVYDRFLNPRVPARHCRGMR